MFKSVKVGVIGVGTMGRHHARVYRELGADLVGVVDTDFIQASQIARMYETKAFSSCEQLFDCSPQAISVAVPTMAHAEVAIDAASRDISAIIEKPIADSVDAARKIIVKGRNSAGILMVGHIERFNPAVMKLKEIVTNEVLGELITFSARRVGPFVERIKDVGITVDIGTHDIDIARYLVGKEPVGATGKLRSIKNKRGDCAFIILEFESIVASIELNWFTPHKIRSQVMTGTQGIAYADYIGQTVTIYNSDSTTELKVGKEEPLRNELTHFLECVKNGIEPMVTAEDGLKTLEIALDIEDRYYSAFRSS